MNRHDRRAAQKASRQNRAAKMGHAKVHRYLGRARRWLVGAYFDGFPALGDDGYYLDGTWSFPPTVPPVHQGPAIEYAKIAPLRWSITAEVIFRNDEGGVYRVQAGGPIGQSLLLEELTDHWLSLLEEAREKGNPRHHWADVVRAWPLVGDKRGGSITDDPEISDRVH